ncbi:helix-turn-helix domain-containing protein [Methanoregula sp.]|uniref:winged helix-turn-helix transcriptional regulator n=1 Tax=Methanoregula sp. TaxID=2052170 RepID=UPI002BE5E43E|nr:helix-turn-helix domain-containing protein [Methanoregula sp.]HVP96263.1 helix-turn-helix domain-containing protein [Methanoregula sp.]
MHRNHLLPTVCRTGGPAVPFVTCPIHAAVGVLGKKWTLLILRDIALRKITRFNQIRRSLPGLTPRVLTLRLQELEEAGFLRARVIKESPRVVEWELTEKGNDTIPILTGFLAFGAKWCADQVFEDHRPRTMAELYPSSEPAGGQRAGESPAEG